MNQPAGWYDHSGQVGPLNKAWGQTGASGSDCWFFRVEAQIQVWHLSQEVLPHRYPGAQIFGIQP